MPVCDRNCVVNGWESQSAVILRMPLSNVTISRRINELSTNIDNDTARALSTTKLALQVDETADITVIAQLIVFVKFVYKN